MCSTICNVVMLYYFIVGVLGLAIGSFLNVVIDRIPNGKTIFIDRSKCDYCKEELRWYELVPVLSYVIQNGKCMRCEGKLSYQYPLVELLTAIILVTVVYFSPLVITLELIISIIFILTLIAVTIIDLKLLIIPDQLMYFLFFVFVLVSSITLGWDVFNSGFFGDVILQWAGPVVNHLVSASIAGGFFYALVLLTKGKGMGGGDVKLAYIMGLFLTGTQTLVAIYAAFIIGAVVGLVLLAMRRKKFGQVVPFGPFLSIGALLSLLWAQDLIDLYLTVFTVR